MSSALAIGVSALQVSQQLIDLTGQNIANASTPGYHRQVANLAGIETGNHIGDGVTITGINRQISSPLETALLNNTYESQDVTTQLNNLQQVQAYLAPGPTGSTPSSAASSTMCSNWPPRPRTRPSAASSSTTPPAWPTPSIPSATSCKRPATRSTSPGRCSSVKSTRTPDRSPASTSRSRRPPPRASSPTTCSTSAIRSSRSCRSSSTCASFRRTSTR